MKAVGIILIILCIVALAGVVYYYASSSLTVSYLDCVATDPLSQPDLLESLKTQLEEGTFAGLKLASDTAFSPADSLFYTWTVRISNRTRIPAKAAEIRIIPLAGDIIQFNGTVETIPDAGRETVIEPGEDETIRITVLTGSGMHHVREAIVSWYLWGMPFSQRMTIGQSTR